MSRRNVLVLGASGFIGRRIVAALSATQWAHAIAASRTISPGPPTPGVTTLRLDATDSVALQAALAQADAVISCIAGSTDTILRSGTALLAGARDSARAPRIVYLSSMAAYGSISGLVDERTPLRGDLGDYSQAKAAMDQLAGGQPGCVRLRPGIVYGIGSDWWTNRIARLLVQHRLGDLGAAGTGFCNLVHVDDVAQAAIRAVEVEAAAGEAVNLANPQVLTWNEYFGAYADALGVAPVRRIGKARLAFELLAFGPALKVAALALRGANPLRDYDPIRPWLTAECRRDLRLDGAKATELLGLHYRPLASGLAECAASLKAGTRAQRG